MLADTIFALASGAFRAGVAVIRVSGPQAFFSLQELAGERDFPPRLARLVTLKDEGKLIDRALAICFRGPASFTGEDVVEYQVHGGRAVIDGLLRALARIPGCRLALPGEFTRRAFENGKLDLTEAEAVADLVDAETECQRLQALGQLGGGLARLYQGWAEDLKKALAHQEAEIEFPEEDLPPGMAASERRTVEKTLREMQAHLDDNRRGEILRDGVLVAIIGAPNAGKSSLLNALLQRDAAIVSEEAGTTRDVIEARLDLGGYPVILADTAGLREAEGKVEAEGIRRARNLAREAQLKIALFDGTRPEDAETRSLVDANTIVVRTKADLFAAGATGIHVSSVTGEGIPGLLSVLTRKVGEIFKNRKEGPSLSRARHREALGEAAAALERGLVAPLPELAAEDLRLALRALGKVTGRVHVEDLLDVIFRDFCIGK